MDSFDNMVGNTFGRHAIIVVDLLPTEFEVDHRLDWEIQNVVILENCEVLHGGQVIFLSWLKFGEKRDGVARRPFAVAVVIVNTIVDAHLGKELADGCIIDVCYAARRWIEGEAIACLCILCCCNEVEQQEEVART
mgnify:FL=1